MVVIMLSDTLLFNAVRIIGSLSSDDPMNKHRLHDVNSSFSSVFFLCFGLVAKIAVHFETNTSNHKCLISEKGQNLCRIHAKYQVRKTDLILQVIRPYLFFCRFSSSWKSEQNSERKRERRIKFTVLHPKLFKWHI